MGVLRAIIPDDCTEPHNEERLIDRYNRDFECRLADDADLLQRAFRTRYQVYCVENHFEDPGRQAGFMETDEYDARSRHSVLIYRPTGEILGTVRLILPVNGVLDSFSMQGIGAHCGDALPVPVGRTAEVSRFSISKRSRQGTETNVSLFRSPSQNAGAIRRAEPLMSLGLIQGLVRMSKLHGITHWCAVMEPKMLRMLSAMGIHFIPVGGLVEHHGLRQLCYCEVAGILRTMKIERPTFWEVVADARSAGLALAS
jgi:N-acyl amino acid synthase of PEP-CTERM/exosortase system